jgi:hypothetical protein
MWRSRLVDLAYCGRRTSFLCRGFVREQSRLDCLEFALGERAVRPQPRDFLELLDEFRRRRDDGSITAFSPPARQLTTCATGRPSNRRRDQGPPHTPIRRLRPAHTAVGEVISGPPAIKPRGPIASKPAVFSSRQTSDCGPAPLAGCRHINHGRARAECLGRSWRSGAGTRRGHEGLAWPRLGEARRTPA